MVPRWWEALISMMTCERFAQLRGDYLEGSLETSLRARFENHADRCPACRDSLLEALLLPARWEDALRDGCALEPREGWQARVSDLLVDQPREVRDECYLTWPDLSALLDEELERDSRQAVRSHLRSCLPCAGEFRTLVALDARLRGLRVEPAGSLCESLAELSGQARFGPRPAARFHRGLRGVAAVAAAVATLALGLGGMWSLRSSSPPAGPMQLARVEEAVLVDRASVEPATTEGLPEIGKGTQPAAPASYEAVALASRGRDVVHRRVSRRAPAPSAHSGPAVLVSNVPPSGASAPEERATETTAPPPAPKGSQAPLGLKLEGWTQVVSGLPAPTSGSAAATPGKGPVVVKAVSVPASAATAGPEAAFEPGMSAGLY